ncbi:MAG: siphovirus Gp157 family protein [Thiobacillus sp.]
MNLFNEVAEFKQTADELYNLDLDEQTLSDTLEAARFPVEQKAVNVAMVIRNFEAHSAAIKAQEEAMAARRKASEKRAAWLKEYLLSNMLAAGICKVESPYFKLSIAKNPGAVVVDCESAIPADYFKQPETPPPVLDKNLVKQAIKDGYEVPGCHIEQSDRLVIK